MKQRESTAKVFNEAEGDVHSSMESNPRELSLVEFLKTLLEAHRQMPSAVILPRQHVPIHSLSITIGYVS
jgi:hypothetical protein